MSIIKAINVNNWVVTPSKETYCEAKLDRKGRVLLEEKTDEGGEIWRFTHQLKREDTPVYVDKRIGDIITFALDKIDDKANGEEIRKRFALSCRVEEAMQNGGLLKVENKDWKCIESTLENIKNPLFNYRIQEAIDTAEICKEKERE